jgi:hypothetical protein
MPSYIELDKQGSFPPSSNVGKVILGVNSSGNVTLTNESGTTTPVGSNGTGLYIPKPIVYGSEGVGNIDHYYDQPISNLGDGSGLPGAIQNSWSSNWLKLTYDTTDETFLNYNPKYFLFVYQGNGKQSKPTINNTSRINNEKLGKYFAHPPSFSGGSNVSTYRNFSGNALEPSSYLPSFSSYTTEWIVTPGKGKGTILDGFNPLRFYSSYINATPPLYKGQEFFPIRVDDCIGNLSGSTNEVSVTTVKNPKYYLTPRTSPITTYVKPRLSLYIKFAIVINDPNNVGRYLIGQMSDTVKIYPKEGYFFDDININDTFKYYYDWSWKFE